MPKSKIRNPFSKKKQNKQTADTTANEHNAYDIDFATKIESMRTGKGRFPFLSLKEKHKMNNESKRGNSITPFAYSLIGSKIPKFTEYRETYEQAGMPLVYEAYLSTGFLIGFIVMVPTFVFSLLLELRFLPTAKALEAIIGSVLLCGVVLGVTVLLWLLYPLSRRRNFKSELENKLAYSFGILGVLAAAGITLDRLFEKIATSESNPVLAELAKRFLRDVRLFGMDSGSALREVAAHSPSRVFASMLDSIAVAYKTTGTIKDLVLFESSRLLQDKSDNLKRAISSLSVMAELYITLVVVGPIIFIVMLSIFGLLPAGGLPSPILLINIIVFLGIPVLSAVFILLLDSIVGKT